MTLEIKSKTLRIVFILNFITSKSGSTYRRNVKLKVTILYDEIIIKRKSLLHFCIYCYGNIFTLLENRERKYYTKISILYDSYPFLFSNFKLQCLVRPMYKNETGNINIEKKENLKQRFDFFFVVAKTFDFSLQCHVAKFSFPNKIACNLIINKTNSSSTAI